MVIWLQRYNIMEELNAPTQKKDHSVKLGLRPKRFPPLPLFLYGEEAAMALVE